MAEANWITFEGSRVQTPVSPHSRVARESLSVDIDGWSILARNDPGSDALRAVMIGNVVLHVVAFVLDVMDQG